LPSTPLHTSCITLFTLVTIDGPAASAEPRSLTTHVRAFDSSSIVGDDGGDETGISEFGDDGGDDVSDDCSELRSDVLLPVDGSDSIDDADAVEVSPTDVGRTDENTAERGGATLVAVTTAVAGAATTVVIVVVDSIGVSS
jgi:hypothetical protein